MARYKGTFKCTIMTPDSLVYENEVHSLFITGDEGEYEILPYHYPVIGILQLNSKIIINWRHAVPVKVGILRFFANDCIVLIEQEEREKKEKEGKEEDMVFGKEDDEQGEV